MSDVTSDSVRLLCIVPSLRGTLVLSLLKPAVFFELGLNAASFCCAKSQSLLVMWVSSAEVRARPEGFPRLFPSFGGRIGVFGI